LELKRFKNQAYENLGKVIDRLKRQKKRQAIPYIFEKALSGVKFEELYYEFRVPA